MNTPWLNGFPFNPNSKIYPPLAPVLIPSFLNQTPNLNSLPFNYNLSSSSNGSSSSTASSPFSFPFQQTNVQQKLSPESVGKPIEKSTSNENLFPANKPLTALSAKSQLFLIERLFPQLVSAFNNSSRIEVKSVESPKPIVETPLVQKPVATPPTSINQVTNFDNFT